MTDCIDMLYAENQTKLSWPIEPSLVYDKN